MNLDQSKSCFLGENIMASSINYEKMTTHLEERISDTLIILVKNNKKTELVEGKEKEFDVRHLQLMRLSEAGKKGLYTKNNIWISDVEDVKALLQFLNENHSNECGEYPIPQPEIGRKLMLKIDNNWGEKEYSFVQEKDKDQTRKLVLNEQEMKTLLSDKVEKMIKEAFVVA